MSPSFLSPALLQPARVAAEESGVAFVIAGLPVLGDHRSARAKVVVRQPIPLARALGGPSWAALGELYLHGGVDVEGDLEAVVAFVDRLQGQLTLDRERAEGETERDVETAFVPPAAEEHSPERDASAIEYHYDQSSRAFELITDPTVMYSCAYFSKPDVTLHEAQLTKLDRTLRKLEVEAGERLLDIGSGWGGLILHAALEVGADATGLTVSAAQAQYTRQRIEAAGCGERCRVVQADYRELETEPPYDKIVSLGMIEHVGLARLGTFFEIAWRALRPGGRFLVQGVTTARHESETRALGFAQTYLFPDAEMPYLTQYLEAACLAGFEVRDVENMREHYALTHRHWRLNLERNWDAVVSEVGETRARALRLLYGFSTYHMTVQRRCEVYQMVLHKPVPGEPYTWKRPL